MSGTVDTESASLDPDGVRLPIQEIRNRVLWVVLVAQFCADDGWPIGRRQVAWLAVLWWSGFARAGPPADNEGGSKWDSSPRPR